MLSLSTSRELKIMETSTHLTFHDILGSWKARWGINRMNYRVEPGLYRVGNPYESSPVLITANYKLSFVRAKDIKEFLQAGMKATVDTRTVRFNAYDRLVLTPIELVSTFKKSLMIFGIFFLLNLLGLGPFGWVYFSFFLVPVS